METLRGPLSQILYLHWHTTVRGLLSRLGFSIRIPESVHRERTYCIHVEEGQRFRGSIFRGRTSGKKPGPRVEVSLF